MTKEELFEIWAPQESLWTPWAKPILFAHCNTPPKEEPEQWHYDLSWVDAYRNKTAFVVELPGPLSVQFGQAIANKSVRPVPLFNALPGPEGLFEVTRLFGENELIPIAMVDVRTIMNRLWQTASDLQNQHLPRHAPPAFLLDSDRRKPGHWLAGRFNNHSYSFSTDYPSAAFLKGQSIEKVIVVQLKESPIEIDLLLTLLKWQDAGLRIFTKPILNRDEPKSVLLRHSFWQRLLFHLSTGAHQSPINGFGHTISAG